MSKIKSTLIAAITAAALAAPALATGTLNVAVPNSQGQWQDVLANLNLYGKWIDGNVTGTAAAMGNNEVVDTKAATYIHLDQVMLGEVGVNLNSALKGVGGDVDLSAVAICNNASVSGGGGGDNILAATQRCNTFDPFAFANVAAHGVGGDFSVSAAAMGNNLATDIVGNLDNAKVTQRNASAVNVNVNAIVSDVGGDVSAQAIAIGNNLSITQRYGD